MRFVSSQRLKGWLSYLTLTVVEEDTLTAVDENPSGGKEASKEASARGADLSDTQTSTAHRRAPRTSGPQTRPMDCFARFAQRHYPPYGGGDGGGGDSSLPKETPCFPSSEGLETLWASSGKEEEDSSRETSSSNTLMSLSEKRSLDLKVDTSSTRNTDEMRSASVDVDNGIRRSASETSLRSQILTTI